MKIFFITHFCILLTTSMLSFKANVYIKTLISANKSKACFSNNRNPVITSWWVLGEKCLPAAIAQLGRSKQCEKENMWPTTAYLWMWLYQERGMFFAACHTEILQSLCLLLRSCQRRGSLASVDCCLEKVSSKELIKNKRDGKWKTRWKKWN